MENMERLNKNLFSNGDVYAGTYKGAVPHGRGKYTWSDGTIYDGDWENGKMTGKGQIIWMSGAKYEGDFSGGYLHGSGTFTSTDGSIYRGGWRMNIRHGFGKKDYSNSDFYEGSWKENVHEGCGSYSWSSNGNTYIGHWSNGKMCGRGVMKWGNGDVFDGFWSNGVRDGFGIYKFGEDGSYYFGTWSKGLKDGKGTFYPAGSKHIPELKTIGSSLEFNSNKKDNVALSNSYLDHERKPRVARSLSERIPIGSIIKSNSFRRASRRGSSLDVSAELSDQSVTCRDSSSRFSDENRNGVEEDEERNNTLIYEREYMQGVLIKERVKSSASLSKRKAKNLFHSKETKKKSCIQIFDSHRSYYLMLNLQLGIRYTVGKITPVPSREVRGSDFGDRARIRMYFPSKGSQFTPPHRSIDFQWKDYCPMVFRNLRELFKLDPAEFMMSICGDDGLRELSSPGKSGSLFYLSKDDRFVIKTLKGSELKVFLRMLPDYYHHVKNHENTLITKFFGLHQIKLSGGRKVRFVVMGNMFCTELRIHQRYDLKGSTHGRFTEKHKIQENATLKDLDLAYDFCMDKLLRESLFQQLSLDCNFLESQNIIDYSLLLGLHFRAPDHMKGFLEPPHAAADHDNSASIEGGTSQGGLSIPPKGLLLVSHEPSVMRSAPGPHIRGSALRAFSLGEKEVDLILPETGRLRVQLGVNMPAQANHKLWLDSESSEIEIFEVYDVVLYMGIIDILQSYNVKKRTEHALKSLKFDPLSISVIAPKVYAKRFMNFMRKVFPEQL
ncbi:LOW QUALITY PROTEIN: phosphatidylinositol 4-phosphate 5-kinase 7-like [Rutidosis leptorrhynchoides]|uniref:LOW QUALITY PROTEIN: phosphatidylinositol 4-phosphate 5-kinase 7-like n=1 Tax=Rutidosis leptorrhynchoides TaxID=125765 RepID=UPI003A9985E3